MWTKEVRSKRQKLKNDKNEKQRGGSIDYYKAIPKEYRNETETDIDEDLWR